MWTLTIPWAKERDEDHGPAERKCDSLHPGRDPAILHSRSKKLSHLRDSRIAARHALIPRQPVHYFVDGGLECFQGARLRRSIGRRQARCREELVPQHSRQHLPLKSLLPPYRFDVAFEARQPWPQRLLGRRGIAAVQPRLKGFHEKFRARTSCSSGDPIEAVAELLGKEELMPNLLRLHASLAAAEMHTLVR